MLTSDFLKFLKELQKEKGLKGNARIAVEDSIKICEASLNE